MPTDERMILETRSWPAVAALPIVRRKPGTPDSGILMASEINKLRGHLEKGTSPEPFYVYLINIWDIETGMLRPQLEGAEKIPFHSLGDLFAADWEVD